MSVCVDSYLFVFLLRIYCWTGANAVKIVICVLNIQLLGQLSHVCRFKIRLNRRLAFLRFPVDFFQSLYERNDFYIRVRVITFNKVCFVSPQV